MFGTILSGVAGMLTGAGGSSWNPLAAIREDTNMLIQHDWAERSAADARQAAERSQERSQAFNAEQATLARTFSAEQAAAQRDWAQNMSNTSWQRGVADMRAAGLNPMLAYSQGGASTPSGAAASTTSASSSPVSMAMARNPSYRAGNLFEGSVSAAQVRNIDAQTARTNAETIEIQERTPTHRENIKLTRERVNETIAHTEALLQQVTTGAATAANLIQQTRNLQEEIPRIRATTQQLRSLASLNEAQIDKAAADAGLSRQQTEEIIQRVRQNLPEIDRAIRDIELKARQLELPARFQASQAHSGAAGAIGAWLRAILPISNFLNALK